MRKKVTFTLVLFSIILLSSAMTTPSQAADYYKVGVKVGDVVEYSISISNSDMVSIVIRVEDISVSVVQLNVTYYYSAHPTQSVNSPFDVTSGYGLYYLLIAPELSVGDPIYLGSSLMINETVTMTVAGVSRTVNHLNYSAGIVFGDYYWDRDTGLLVKSTFRFPFGSENLSLMSTTAFGAPFPTGLVLLLASGIASSVGVIVLIIWVRPRRRINKKQ
jgi:hypothetical protein